MSSVACSAGFASCKTFGKQPKHPCFGAEPPYRSSAICATASVHRQPFVPLHRATALCGCLYASLHSGFVLLTASILAWSRGGSPISAPARTPGVYAQRLCTMQSQLSIHSPSPRGRGFRQGCRNKDTPSFKHGCLQVVEQSRCRTHRQQTTTIAETQSHQSVLKGIGIINQKFISKTGFSYPIS